MGYDELYRLTEQGELEPVNLFFSGHQKEGVWAVRKIDKGTRWTWLVENVADLPKAMTIASLEPFRDLVLQEWIKRGEELMEEVTPYDLASMLFDAVAGKIPIR